jgi:hypothetical protein
MPPRPEAQIELSISLSSDTVSLSQLEKPFNINVTAKALSSSKPSSGIYFNARWTALDNRAGLLKGAFLLRNTSDPNNIIPLAPAVKISYSGVPGNPDLRHNDFERLVVVPGVGKGELNISHELIGERIFQYSRELKVRILKVSMYAGLLPDIILSHLILYLVPSIVSNFKLRSYLRVGGRSRWRQTGRSSLKESCRMKMVSMD